MILRENEIVVLCHIHSNPQENADFVEYLSGDAQRVGDLLIGRVLPMVEKYDEWCSGADFIRSLGKDALGRILELEEELDKEFATLREKVQKATDGCPKTVTLEEALAQQRRNEQTLNQRNLDSRGTSLDATK